MAHVADIADALTKLAANKQLPVSMEDVYKQQQAHREFQQVLDSGTPEGAAKAVAASAAAFAALPLVLEVAPWMANQVDRNKEIDRVLRQSVLAKHFELAQKLKPKDAANLAASVDEFIYSAPDAWRNPETAKIVRYYGGQKTDFKLPTKERWGKAEKAMLDHVTKSGFKPPSRNVIYAGMLSKRLTQAAKSALPFAVIGGAMGIKEVQDRRAKLRSLYKRKRS